MNVSKDSVVGFIGIGVMGRSMATHLLENGFEVQVYNRTRSKAEGLLERGAKWQDSPAAIARLCDVVITIVGYPADVHQVYLGDGGLLENCRRGTIVIDMTTSSPALAKAIFDAADDRGVFALDAPVSGGDIGAREGLLSIMVGGQREIFDAVLPIFTCMGKNIVYQGPAGSGQHCKMANQIAIASNIMGVCEAISYAGKAGLDPETVMQSISTGAAGSWSLSNLGPRMIAGDFAPGFYIKHFIKDMTIALQSCEQLGLDAAGLALAKSLYDKLAEAGDEESGTQALYKYYADEQV